MGLLSSVMTELAKSFSFKNYRNSDRKASNDPKRKLTKMKSSGFMHLVGSPNSISAHSKRGQKGQNQDRFIVWDEFGQKSDTMFCGVFDGHGPWGHHVAKKVRDLLPSYLLDTFLERENGHSQQSAWEYSFIKSCAAVDFRLQHLRNMNTFNSGTTAVALLRQGSNIAIANVGDSRAVLGSVTREGNLAALQLTVDFKPDLPQERARIIGSNGRVACLSDEPGVHRVWGPDEESPGLATSRSFGDFCFKEYGVISEPEIIHRRISEDDKFIILATDGLWEVVSNEEAVKIVGQTKEKGEAAERLVKYASSAWKSKMEEFAMDDISIICIFLHSTSTGL